MLPATLTKFLQLQPVRSRLPVLGRRIVPLFAITALDRNNFSGHKTAPKLLAILHNTVSCLLIRVLVLSLPVQMRHNLIELLTIGLKNQRISSPTNTSTDFIISQSDICSAWPGKDPALHHSYVTISLIVPAPTVCPPSRMAKRKPFSIATGVMSSITRETLSPGITISVPAGNSATPVTSVVRK
jgi:hypothetical protein